VPRAAAAQQPVAVERLLPTRNNCNRVQKLDAARSARAFRVPSGSGAAVARDVQLAVPHHLRNEARHGQTTQCEEGTTFELQGKERSQRWRTKLEVAQFGETRRRGALDALAHG
jgi:hypothetical protein